MRWTVRNIRTFNGIEGQGFNCTLCRDGKPVADVIDEGCGGSAHFQWKDHGTWVDMQVHDHLNVVRVCKGTPEQKLFTEYADTQFWPPNPEVKDLGPLRKGVDGVVSCLVDEVMEERQYRKWCRTKTCFRLKGDKAGEWRVIKMTFDPRVRQHIVSKYGDSVEEILNQRYA